MVFSRESLSDRNVRREAEGSYGEINGEGAFAKVGL